MSLSFMAETLVKLQLSKAKTHRWTLQLLVDKRWGDINKLNNNAELTGYLLKKCWISFYKGDHEENGLPKLPEGVSGSKT